MLRKCGNERRSVPARSGRFLCTRAWIEIININERIYEDTRRVYNALVKLLPIVKGSELQESHKSVEVSAGNQNSDSVLQASNADKLTAYSSQVCLHKMNYYCLKTV